MNRAALALTLILALLFSAVIVTQLTNSVATQTYSTITIKPDGSIEGTDRIQRQGNVYTLTGDISGGIRVEKSYILIDGAGYTIDGNGEESGIDLSAIYSYPLPIQVNNVTVMNLRIINCNVGIGCANTHSNTFIGNYIADCDDGVGIIGSANNTLTHNTVKDCATGISISYSGFSVITENNIIHNNVLVSWSIGPKVDKNYWSGYTGTDRDGDGIGDRSYVYYDTGYQNERYADYHPLVKPVNISDFESPPIPVVPETVPPVVSIVSPENTTLTVNNITLTFTVDEQISWIGYSLDGQANVSITGNTTLAGLADGSHRLIVCAADTYGNVGGSQTLHFFIAQETEPKREPFPITLVVASVALAVAIGTGLVFYLKKRRRDESP